MQSLKEMDKFLDTYDLTKLNQEDINYLSRSIMSNETEAVIKNLPTKENSGPDGFTAKIYQTIKEELTAMLLKLFHKLEKEAMLPISFYETSISLVPKVDKDTTKRENCRPIFLIT
jgi:hypothetical protein